MKLLHIDTNRTDGTLLPDAFIAVMKTIRHQRNYWSLVFRIPLVHKVDNFYDMFYDCYKENVWCTPMIAFHKRFAFELTVTYNLHFELYGE